MRMNITKYLISAVLILAALIMAGEIHTWHLSEFETGYTRTTFYPEKGTEPEAMLDDIEAAAEKAGVDVFVVERDVRSLVSESVSVYGTSGTAVFLKNDIDLESKVYSSILLGNIDVSIKDIRQTPDITSMEDYFIIGDSDSAVLFKQELVNRYAGAFPEAGYRSFNATADIIGIWVGVLLAILLLSGFDTSRWKKELIIRIVSGEDLTYIVIKRTLTDAVILNAIFIASFVFAGLYTDVSFRWQYTLLCWIIFNLINIGLSLSAMRMDFRRSASGRSRSRSLLAAGYIYCGILSLIAMIIMTGSVAAAADGLECMKQKDFFQSHSSSSYVMISLDYDTDDYGGDESDWPDTKLSRSLYQQQLSEGKTCAMVELSGLTEQSDDNYIFADKGALAYISENISEIRDNEPGDGVYIIEPENYRKTKNKADESDDLAEFYTGEKAEHISYSGNVELTATDCEGSYKGVLKKDPVIILCNKSAYEADSYTIQGTLFDISDSDWAKFISDNHLEKEVVYRTGAYDNYLYNWNIARNKLALGILLSVLMMVIVTLVMSAVIRSEFKARSSEIILKKLLGYDIFSRYAGVFYSVLISGMTGTAALVMTSLILGTGKLQYMAVSAAAVILIYFLILILDIRKLERIGIQRVLKGGYM